MAKIIHIKHKYIDSSFWEKKIALFSGQEGPTISQLRKVTHNLWSLWGWAKSLFFWFLSFKSSPYVHCIIIMIKVLLSTYNMPDSVLVPGSTKENKTKIAAFMGVYILIEEIDSEQ